MNKIISIVVPAKMDAEKYIQDHHLTVWHSNTLAFTLALMDQIRGHLLDNKPIQAYKRLQTLEKEIKARLEGSNG